MSLPDRSGPQYVRSLGCWMDISRSLCRAGGDFLEVSQEPARSGHWGDYPSLEGGDKEAPTIVAVALWLIFTEQNRETGGCIVWRALKILGPLHPPLRLDLLFLGAELPLGVIQCFSSTHYH